MFINHFVLNRAQFYIRIDIIMKKIVLEDYNPQWAIHFLELKNVYQLLLNEHILSIEHIGSTSIPGIKAKPVIDIDIIVESPESLSFAIHQLEKSGYIHQGDLGIKGGEAFRRVSSKVPFSNSQREWPLHHLYVCQKGIESLQNHLLFRDYLRNHPEKARQYSTLKEALVKSVDDDMYLYVVGKTEFICTILKEIGFNETSIAAIKEQNRKLN